MAAPVADRLLEPFGRTGGAEGDGERITIRHVPANRSVRADSPIDDKMSAMTSPSPAIRTVGVPREVKTAEHRVAMTPDGVRELERHGIEVMVEAGAGEGASISDADYVAAGADIVPTAADAWAQDMVVKVKEPKAEEFEFLRRRPDAVHLPPSGGVSRGRRGAARCRHHGGRVRDGATSRRVTPAARPDERGRRPSRAPDGRPLPRTPQRWARRVDGRFARRSAGQGRRARSGQRRLERGVDRRGDGGRGRPDRQEPRSAPLRRPDPSRPHHDRGVEPRRDRTGRHRCRPRDRCRARRRRACAGRRRRGARGADEAAFGDRRRGGRSGRLHRHHPRDDARRADVCRPRRRPLRGRQHARCRAAHVDLRADQRHAALPVGRGAARRDRCGPPRSVDRPRLEHRRRRARQRAVAESLGATAVDALA